MLVIFESKICIAAYGANNLFSEKADNRLCKLWYDIPVGERIE